jgi:hypothetical protein
MRIIRYLVFTCTLVVDVTDWLLIGMRLCDGERLCPCAPRAPRALVICCHKTLLQKKLELLLVGILS